MEVSSNLLNFFLKERVTLSDKRDLNWKNIKVVLIAIVSIGALIILLWPSKETLGEKFYEKKDLSQTTVKNKDKDEATSAINNLNSNESYDESDPTQKALEQLQQGARNNSNTNDYVHNASVHSSLDYLYKSDSSNSTSTSKSLSKNYGAGGDNSSSMILSRGGTSAKDRLSAGVKFLVRLTEKVIVSDQGVPIIGIVTSDVLHENSVAIARGSKLIGTISFDESSDRAQVAWQLIIFLDGRERPLSGIGIGIDGQSGIIGKVKSKAILNTVGQTITRVVGAYAEGSMSKGQFGSSDGGHKNGIRNAIKEVAQDKTQDFADDISKEKRWIEIDMNSEFYTLLNQSFQFRDPGNTYGK